MEKKSNIAWLLAEANTINIKQIHVAKPRPGIVCEKHTIVLGVLCASEVVVTNDELLLPNIEGSIYNPHYIITRAGEIIELAPPDSLVNCINMNSKLNNIDLTFKSARRSVEMDRHSVYIYLVSHGPVVSTRMGYRSYDGHKVDNVYEFINPFKHHRCYEKYTKLQIESCKNLIYYLRRNLNNYTDFFYRADGWMYNKNIITFPQGVITTCVFRTDLATISPQPALIEMLENL